MYSIFGRGSFCFNYFLNSAWHGGDQFVELLKWYGSPGFFDSGVEKGDGRTAHLWGIWLLSGIMS